MSLCFHSPKGVSTEPRSFSHAWSAWVSETPTQFRWLTTTAWSLQRSRRTINSVKGFPTNYGRLRFTLKNCWYGVEPVAIHPHVSFTPPAASVVSSRQPCCWLEISTMPAHSRRYQRAHKCSGTLPRPSKFGTGRCLTIPLPDSPRPRLCLLAIGPVPCSIRRGLLQ